MASKLSNLTHKVADKIEEMGNKNKQSNDPNSTNYGPHSSNAANKLDPKVDSDRDGRNDPHSRVGGYGNTQSHDTYGTTTGPGGIASSDTYGSTTNNPGYNNPQSTNAGPHSSNLANKLDPRVDSDRDGRNDPTSRTGGYGNTQHHGDGYGTAGGPGGIGSTDTGYGHTQGTMHNTSTTGGYGTTGTTAGTTGGYGGSNTVGDHPGSTNHGPHGSNMMNKLDPRVDSDRDGRHDPSSRAGGYGQTQGVDTYGTTAGHTTHDHTTTGHNTGYGTSNTVGNHPGSTNQGPHSSNLMNKLDPRVDSDRDGRDDPSSRVGGIGQTQGGYGAPNTGTGYGTNTTTTTHTTTGYGTGNNVHDNPQSTNHGPHNSNLLNKLDPRVDSDRDGRHDPTSRVGGTGQTQNPGYY